MPGPITHVFLALSVLPTQLQDKNQKEFIVGTEDNFVYGLQVDNPNKIFYPVGTSCSGMNQLTMEKIKLALEQMKYKICMPKEIRLKAKHALDKMLRI